MISMYALSIDNLVRELKKKHKGKQKNTLKLHTIT